MQIYVDGNAVRSGNGQKEYPFQTISEAAKIARPGDEVLVAPGVYREYVDPANAGCEDARIVYRSVEPGKAVITGAEIVDNWEHLEGDVWTARVSNGLFGDYNPYTTLVSGDWFIASYTAHTGEVYLNGKSMYEVTSLDKVKKPEIYKKSWDQAFTVYTWYVEQDEEKNETVFYVNFQGKNPNEETVEINVRENCFYPSKEGIGYITLAGFVVKQAATQWAPPTAYQEGMVGPHWSKGWIIEDCEISDSKCSGISLGKYRQPNNDNKWLKWKFKDGTQTERDCICQAQREGWTKENIGSHIIRRCNIHDCGQTGIVGHLGGVFSIIEDNHIHHINNKQNLAGAEIGGIKMHAAIDVIIRRNHFHHCTRGLWLDWQAQGTRVTQNLFHDNTLPNEENANPEGMDGIGEDIFIEISHGPTLVDNNVLLSDRAIKLATQGVAVVHNLIAGSFTAVGRGVNNGSEKLPSPRYTPYHVPHRTEINGFMTVLHGDEDAFGGEWNGWGYEMTMKLKEHDTESCMWVVDMMSNLARYTYTTNRFFEANQYIKGNGTSLHIGANSSITALLLVNDTEAKPQMSVYGKTEFIQLVGITESELQAIIADRNNIPKLIACMEADGNTDLVTDMRRSKSYF